MSFRLLNLGKIDSFDTQAIYEAVGLAKSSGVISDTIIFCYPSYPIVCIGYHQSLEKDVDLRFCKEHGIPIVRRILGGGAVLLDGNQLFYQIIVARDNPLIPVSVEEAYEVLLRGPVEAYRELGIPAEYRAVNDIQVHGRKISGNGATILDDTLILTGNIILDFNYKLMGKTLKVPSEKFRDKIVKTMEEWVTTANKELGRTVNIEEATKALKTGFEKALGITFRYEKLTKKEKDLLEIVRTKYHSQEWLFAPELSHPHLTGRSEVKITGDIKIVEACHKAKGGLIRTTLELVGDNINDIMITGDFFFIPKEKLLDLENAVRGARADRADLLNTIQNFYQTNKVETPGVSPEDFVTAILTATQT